jgi:hypothetical protein
MRPVVNLTLTCADRLSLESVVGDRNTARKHVWRAEVVVLSESGQR